MCDHFRQFVNSPKFIRERSGKYFRFKRANYLLFKAGLLKVHNNNNHLSFLGSVAACHCGCLFLFIHVSFSDQAWAESMNMGAFLSVSRGSDEPLKFLEIDYTGGKTGEAPVVFVGKGVTFDT